MDMSLCKRWELLMDRKAWCPWGLKELDTTEQLNWTELNASKALPKELPNNFSCFKEIETVQQLRILNIIKNKQMNTIKALFIGKLSFVFIF